MKKRDVYTFASRTENITTDRKPNVHTKSTIGSPGLALAQNDKSNVLEHLYK